VDQETGEKKRKKKKKKKRKGKKKKDGTSRSGQQFQRPLLKSGRHYSHAKRPN